MSTDKIPVFYDTIDRHALVVRRKKPFMDWLISKRLVYQWGNMASKEDLQIVHGMVWCGNLFHDIGPGRFSCDQGWIL